MIAGNQKKYKLNKFLVVPDPFISIIIPVYNSSENIIKTLTSVDKLEYKNFECIIVNDGSVDNSEKIIKDFIADKEKFKLYSKINNGVCVARNFGVEKSIGDYLLFLDSDDLIESNFLNETIKNLDDSIDIVATKVIFFGRSKGVYIPNIFTLNDLLHENKLVITCLIKKNKFIDVGGFNPNMKDGFEDWDFWIRYFNKYPNIMIIDSTSFYYRLQIKSRNRNIDGNKESKLRHQIWKNNYDLFAKEFFDPKKTFEYKNIYNSAEYKLGRFLLKPIRFLLNK